MERLHEIMQTWRPHTVYHAAAYKHAPLVVPKFRQQIRDGGPLTLTHPEITRYFMSIPEGDIAIELSGLRPGEKLYEELLLGDNPSPTLHPRILKAQDDFLPWAQLEGHLAELDLALQHNDVPTIRLQLQHLVPGYTPNKAIVDWVYLEQQAG